MTKLCLFLIFILAIVLYPQSPIVFDCQPVALAQHYAPVIRALKTELVTILKEGEGLSQ